MSNANRDYAVVYDVKNSSLALSRPLIFYITDKNTSNIFVRLVTRVSVGNGIDQYTNIEEASNYVLTMRVIKPNNEVKSIEATQHETESIFQFDLAEDFKDIPGKYTCELTISTIVSSRQELITSDPFSYEVKRSILSNVGEIIETEDATVEKLLNNLEATKAELSSQIKDIATNGTTMEVIQNKVSEMAQNGSITFNTITPEMTTFIGTEKSINLFNKDEVITNAYFYKTSDGNIETESDNRYACFKIKITADKNYTVTSTGFSTYFSPINSNVAESYSIRSGETVLNLPPGDINRQGDYMAYISFRQDNNPISSYMMVEGDTLPSKYTPFYNKKIINEEIGLSKKCINTILAQTDTGKKFFVGNGGDYNTLTECLEALKDDVDKKIIYMYPGEYNIYEEIGGSTFGLSIDDTTSSWKDVSIVVPENTSIIGLGKVTLKFFPSSTEISSKGAQLLSCLNVVHKNFRLENVEIICGNCRYGVHDETGGGAPYGKHIYKNVTIEKRSTSLGMSQAFGCGFSRGEILEFENCYFYASRLPFTCHNNGTVDIDNAIIKANNCIFDSKNTDNTIRFGNVNSKQVEVKVDFNSCFIKNGIDIKNESTTERPNAFNLMLLRSGNPTITISTATNIYEPKIFAI